MRERMDHVNPKPAVGLLKRCCYKVACYKEVGMLANGYAVTTYDTMVFHGDAMKGQLFADDIIDQSQKVNLNGKNSILFK